MKQQNFEKTNWKHCHSHGGVLRQKRAGRKFRPLSTKQTIHLVFKANKEAIRGGFRAHRRFKLIHLILRKYALHFWVKIEQLSIQGDHIHILIRAPRRSKYQNFFRVAAGQIAQRFQKEGLMNLAVTDTSHQALRKDVKLWKHRPFTRVVIGWAANKIVRDYVQLSEKEAAGEIVYRKERLRGLSVDDWQILWS